MIIVLTGGTGLIGNSLGQALVKVGHKVRVLARNPDQAHVPFPCEVFEWSGGKEPPPLKAFENVEAVIHLAGENIAAKRWTSARKKELRDSRVNSAEGLRLAIERSGVRPKVFISASGIGYFGDRGDEFLTEKSAAGEDFLAKLCVEWEAAADRVPADRTVKARFGVALSNQGGFLRQVVPLFQTVGASRLGSGRQWFSWIHIEDLVSSLMKMLEDTSLTGAFNVCAPEAVTNAEITQELRRVIHANPAPPAPGPALKVMYGDLSVALLGSQRARPERLSEVGFEWKYPNVREAVEHLLGNLRTGDMQLVFDNWLPAPVKEVWPFFSSEQNLEKITPPFLGFKVIGKNTDEIRQGTLIDYKIKLRGFPMKWRTEISEWVSEKRFTDIQLKGPYAKWHHTHEFETLEGGTLMRDTIIFKPPMGLFGRLVALPFVLGEVEGIFRFRSEIIRQIFSRVPATSPR